MKIIRNENSISWQDKHSAGSVGIIASSSRENGQDTLREDWIEFCAANAVAIYHSVKDTIAWMKENWDVETLDETDERMGNYYGNIVEHFYGEMLTHHPVSFSLDMSDETFTQWHRETEARREEAKNLPKDKTGIILYGFRLPLTERNLADLQAGINDDRAFSREAPDGEQSKIEPSTCYIIYDATHRNIMLSGNGISVIGRRLVEYMGITQNDIDTRSQHFMVYIHKGLGGLPTYAAFREARDCNKSK